MVYMFLALFSAEITLICWLESSFYMTATMPISFLVSSVFIV